MRLSGLVSQREKEDVHGQRYWCLSWGSEPERAAVTAARGGADQTAVAAAILRQLYAVVVHEQAWDPVVAAHGTRHALEVLAA